MNNRAPHQTVVVVRLLSIQGGYFAYLRALLPELQRGGHDVLLVVITTKNLRPAIQGLLPSIQVRFVDEPSFHNAYLQPCLFRLLQSAHTRYILVNDLYESLFFFSYASLYRKTALYVVVHSTLRDMPGSRKFTVAIIYTLHRLLQSLVAMYISVSSYCAENLISAGIQHARIVVVPNGLPPVQVERVLRSGRNNLSVGYVGRFSHEKGPDIFLKTAALCLDLPVTFTLFGTGPLGEQIREQVRDMSNCQIEPTLNDAGEIYSRLDVLIIPSRSEGQPYAVLEAFQNNVLVIGSTAGGLPELLQGRGIMIEPNTPERYRNALQHVLENGQDVSVMKEAALTYMQRDGGAMRMGKAYLNLLKKS